MADFFIENLHFRTDVAHILAASIKCALILKLVAVSALFFIWLERKVSGRIQDRLGPTRVGGLFGWLQTLADGIKLLQKEDLMPADADKFLFKIAPYVSFAASFAAFLALPFSDGWVAYPVNAGVFFVLAVLGLEVFGVILAGYASGSKWSLFGAMREAAQVVSYEVPLGMCVVVPVFLSGTLDLVAIGNMQAGAMTNWFIFNDPFTFGIFWIYFTCAVASVNRAPFDLAEAESELVAGFHTEYSGLRWSFFFMAEYGSMLLVSMLACILFLGAWHGPIPVFEVVGQSVDAAWFGIVAKVVGVVNLLTKAVIGVTVMVWVRWTFPRLRIDQVLTTCLKYCVPLAAFCFLGSLAWNTLGLPTGADAMPSARGSRADQRESYTPYAVAAAKNDAAVDGSVDEGDSQSDATAGPDLHGSAPVDADAVVATQVKSASVPAIVGGDR